MRLRMRNLLNSSQLAHFFADMEQKNRSVGKKLTQDAIHQEFRQMNPLTLLFFMFLMLIDIYETNLGGHLLGSPKQQLSFKWLNLVRCFNIRISHYVVDKYSFDK